MEWAKKARKVLADNIEYCSPTSEIKLERFRSFKHEDYSWTEVEAPYHLSPAHILLGLDFYLRIFFEAQKAFISFDLILKKILVVH